MSSYNRKLSINTLINTAATLIPDPALFINRVLEQISFHNSVCKTCASLDKGYAYYRDVDLNVMNIANNAIYYPSIIKLYIDKPTIDAVEGLSSIAIIIIEEIGEVLNVPDSIWSIEKRGRNWYLTYGSPLVKSGEHTHESDGHEDQDYDKALALEEGIEYENRAH